MNSNMPRFVVKYYRGEKKFSPVYLMGNLAAECYHAGILTTDAVEVFIERSVVKEIPFSEINEKYSNHAGFSPDTKNVTYYELQNQLSWKQ